MNIAAAPTDSLYKFASIFCLGIIIASMISIVTLNDRHNALVYDILQQEHQLREDSNLVPNKEARLQTLASYARTAKEDTRFFQKSLVRVAGVSFSVALISFCLWYLKEQRIKDELLRLTLEKARKEHDHGEE